MELALAHVEALAEGIGSRLAGSASEREAALYLQEQLSSYGYDVTLQSFTFDEPFDAGTTLEVVSPRKRSVPAYALEPGVSGQAEGELVFAGLGRPAELPPQAQGRIALVERGELFEKTVANAAAAGAVATLIFNNEPGPFWGEMEAPGPIPAASISREDGLALLSLLGQGPVTVKLDVRIVSGPRQSQNVVGRPATGDCRVVAGAHYDSVAVSPGANDNASGTATVLEMARVLAADGRFEDVCFVLFGVEEVRLSGSRAFVDSLTVDEQGRIRAMLNFDMVGAGNRWFLDGSPTLLDIVLAELDGQGLAYDLSEPSTASGGSDHARFIEAGIPAVLFHRAGDPHYHTAEDEARFVRADELAEIGGAGLAIIDRLLHSP